MGAASPMSGDWEVSDSGEYLCKFTDEPPKEKKKK